ncbi:MAG TPA: Smr/MutS family protein [Polyangiales bacterium]
MARRHKKRRDDERREPSQKPAPTPTTSLAALFKASGHAKLAPEKPPDTPAPAVKPAPPPPPARSVISPAAEMRMLNDAYAGVRPLSTKSNESGRLRAPRPERDAELERARDEEAAARARLAALVGGGVRFKIVREDDFVQGHRSDASPKLLARISGKGFAPDATLDLHGERASNVADVVARFARAHHRRGARQLLVIAGKGLHSANGVSVLRDALIDALTQGVAAPIVIAFATAHASQGGTGAVAVLLT